MHRLISLPFSPYVEKARWALDRARIGYREERYMPVFSSIAVAWAVRGSGGEADRVSSRFSSPALLLDDGRALRSSGAIARHADEAANLGWYAVEGAAEREAWYHDHLGPQARRVAYGLAFQDRTVLDGLARGNVSPRQAAWFARLNPVVERMVSRLLAVESKRERSLHHVRSELDDVARRLADGRPFLLGDRFSAADLTFACMLTPALLPTPAEGFGGVFPVVDTLPAEARELVAEVRAHPAGQFALRMFAEQRQPEASAPGAG